MLSISLTFAMAPTVTDGDTTSAEEQLLARCRRGDQVAFATLIRTHQRRVFRLAGRFFRHREDVEEVAQESFLLAWRKLDGYRASAPFEHWLTRITLNCCYQRLRRRQLPIDPIFDEGPSTPRAEAHDPLARLEVDRLLARLAPADRFILLLLDGEGWPVQEIADRLGWSTTNVKVRAHRARKRLRRLLEGEPGCAPGGRE